MPIDAAGTVAVVVAVHCMCRSHSVQDDEKDNYPSMEVHGTHPPPPRSESRISGVLHEQSSVRPSVRPSVRRRFFLFIYLFYACGIPAPYLYLYEQAYGCRMIPPPSFVGLYPIQCLVISVGVSLRIFSLGTRELVVPAEGEEDQVRKVCARDRETERDRERQRETERGGSMVCSCGSRLMHAHNTTLRHHQDNGI